MPQFDSPPLPSAFPTSLNYVIYEPVSAKPFVTVNHNALPMSLLRACTQAISRPALSKPLVAPLRYVSSEVKAPEQSRPKTGEPVEITPMPEKDVRAADAISGAPCALRRSHIHWLVILIIFDGYCCWWM